MKYAVSCPLDGDSRQYLYEALINSMPVHKSRSPYGKRGIAYCANCGVWIWESALQMKHGVWRHKKCGTKVRLHPVPCKTEKLERLKRKKPKRHYSQKTRESGPLKPKAKDYINIFLYCKALEEYIEKLEEDLEEARRE